MITIDITINREKVRQAGEDFAVLMSEKGLSYEEQIVMAQMIIRMARSVGSLDMLRVAACLELGNQWSDEHDTNPLPGDGLGGMQ